MCAAYNLTQSVSIQEQKSSTSKSPVPKWLKMKQQNKSSAGQTAKPTAKQSSSAQKPQQETRNQKRARWAKKAVPKAKPSVKRGPEKEYLCECHGEPARKTRAGTKETVKDHDSGKMKETPKGLGKWKCATTGKTTKVTPRKPKAITVDMTAVEQRVVAELSTNATNT